VDDENPSGQQWRTGDDQLSLAVGDVAGIARARHALGDQLDAWGFQETEGAVLVFSELVTNAVVHAGGAVGASVTRHGPRVRIDVQDRGAGVVGERIPGTAPGGLGLRIVSRLSDRWGTESTPDGKVVWAVVPCGADGDPSTDSERTAGSAPVEDPATAAAPPAGGAQPPTDAHALELLHRLVGTWATAATHPDTGAQGVLGSVEVSWLEGGGSSSTGPAPTIPTSRTPCW
jgi:anti-sigma regulatory factor (Ser/Thr protein kinase)